MQPSQGDIPMPRPISPESMETLEQAREYAASVTLNALRNRHQRGFSLPSTNAGPRGISNQQNYSMGPGSSYGYLTRPYNAPSQEGAGQSGGNRSSREGSRHSVESLSDLANFASTSAMNSLSHMSRNLGDEFVMPRPGAINADSTSPVNEQSQHMRIPSDDLDPPPSRVGESISGQEGPVMVEVEGEQIQVAVVTDSRAVTRFQPRAESAYVGRIPHSRRQRTSQHSSNSSSQHYPSSSNHSQSVRGRSTPRYQAQLSRRSLPGHVSLSNRRFMQSAAAPTQPSSREGEEDGQQGEGLRRRRPSRFGFHRTALRRRVLHSHYSSSLFDNNQPPSPSVHHAINRAIANALAGRGQMAVANNVSNRTHRLQWWDFSDYVLPDISDSQSNVIVSECKIHNDASVDVSRDRRLAAFIPSHMGFPDHGILAVCSLEQHNLGEVLYTKSFGPNAITVSLSPTGTYILVGLAARRLHWQMFHGLMADVYQLQKPGAGEDSMTFVSRIIHPLDYQQRLVVSVNIARWIPRPGAGIVYGTNRGDLCICTPKLDNEDEPLPCEVSSTFESRMADSESNTRQLDMVERRRSYSELGVMAVRLSNSQSSGTSQDTSTQAGAGPQRRAQSTQTRGNVVQNMATQTDFSNEGHAAGRQRVAERRSDVSVAIRSGTMMGASHGDGSEENLQTWRARNRGGDIPDSQSEAFDRMSDGIGQEGDSNGSSTSSDQHRVEQRGGRTQESQSTSPWRHVGPGGDAGSAPHSNVGVDHAESDDESDEDRRVNFSDMMERDGNDAAGSGFGQEQGSEPGSKTFAPVASHMVGPGGDATSTMTSSGGDSPPHNGAGQSCIRNDLPSHTVGPGGDAVSTMQSNGTTQLADVDESMQPTSTNHNQISYGRRRSLRDQFGEGSSRDAALARYSGDIEMDCPHEVVEVSRTISSSSDVDRRDQNQEMASSRSNRRSRRFGMQRPRHTNLAYDHPQVASTSGTDVNNRHIHSLNSGLNAIRTSNASRNLDTSLDRYAATPGHETSLSDNVIVPHRNITNVGESPHSPNHVNLPSHQPSVGSSNILEGYGQPFLTHEDRAGTFGEGIVDTSSNAFPAGSDSVVVGVNSSIDSVSLVTSSVNGMSGTVTPSRTNQTVSIEGSIHLPDNNVAGLGLVDSSASRITRNITFASSNGEVNQSTHAVDTRPCEANSSRQVNSQFHAHGADDGMFRSVGSVPSLSENWDRGQQDDELDGDEVQNDVAIITKSDDIR